MILPGGPLRVYVATRPVDFRKGMDGLAALAAAELRLDPFSGVVLVFRAKRADRVKILVWDGSGAVLVAKRLEQGKFAWPGVRDGVMRLSAIVAALKRALFGRRSERRDPHQLDPGQLDLALEDVEQEFGEPRAEADAGDPTLKTERARRRRVNRGALHRHLPQVEVVVEPESRTCTCCGEAHRPSARTSASGST